MKLWKWTLTVLAAGAFMLAACGDDSSSSGEVCGDGTRGPVEECDGSDLGGETCASLGLGSGTLACGQDCFFDVGNCSQTSNCGNGTQEYPEDCDGQDLQSATCQALGFTGGQLGCSLSCTFDTANCQSGGTCGNNQWEQPEQCDGSDLAGQTCQSLGLGSGNLVCAGDCTFDVSGCANTATCGNGAWEFPELCDGADLHNNTCADFGFYSGTLACQADCMGFDTAGCTETCGDNAINGAETCDGPALGGNDCTTIGMGFTGGTLACAATCDGWDTTLCTGGPTCGDGQNTAYEKCDDSNTHNGDGCNPTCDLFGTVTTVAGTAGQNGSADGIGPAAEFDVPAALASDGTYLYVADTTNCTIRKIDMSNWDVTTLAGSAGQCSHADGSAATARFNIPLGIVYHNGYLYLTDTNNNVIRQVDATTGDSSTVAGQVGNAGSNDGTGTAAQFAEPRGLATDGVNLYISDFGNCNVRQVVIGTWVVTTLAGQSGNCGGGDGQGTNAQFNLPRGIAVDGNLLFVADTGNSTIRQVDMANNNTVTTIAGTAGQTGTTDAQGTAARFNSPRGIVADAESIYVADFANHTIRQIQRGSWNVTTLCGVGGSNGSADGTGTNATMDNPWGLAFDPNLAQPNQRLYVSETGNHIIRTID